MRASVVISALVAVLVGFGGSVAIILAAARALGASPSQTSSWVAALCLSMMATTAILSIRHRQPIVTAWSTPGAALLAASAGVGYAEAVGAFLLAAVLLLATAASRGMAGLIGRIPTPVASAMLAGVLFEFVMAIFTHAKASPALVLPLIGAFAVLRMFSPAWAVLAVLALGIGLSFALQRVGPIAPLELSRFELVMPAFDLTTLIGVGLPLYLVTMASQNLPGFAVLRAAGYAPPTRSILGVTGLASLLSAPFGAHSTNLAAITASICTGPDAHPDPAKRWLCGPFYAAGYAALAAFAGSLVIAFDSFPPALIVTVAGIALAGPLVNALSTALAEKRSQFAAVMTFAVTASGLSVFGIGAAFWGLVAGLAIHGLERAVAR